MKAVVSKLQALQLGNPLYVDHHIGVSTTSFKLVNYVCPANERPHLAVGGEKVQRVI
mgnify:CR=1 FL=1